MGVNKVEFDGKKLIDLTGDTVTKDVLKKGFTAHGSDGEPIDGVFVIKNQEKTISPKKSIQTVLPDSGYDGLSKVVVNNMKLQQKNTKSVITDSLSVPGSLVSPDSGYDGLDFVAVQAVYVQQKTVSPTTSAQTIKPDSGYDGLSSVSINAARLQNKSITPTSSIQTIYPDSGFYGLGAVSVAAVNSDKVAKGSFTSGAVGEKKKIELGFKPSFISIIKSSNKTTTWVVYNENVSVKATYYSSPSENRINAYTIGGNSSPVYSIDSDGWTFNCYNSGFSNVQVEWVACAW